MDSSEIKDHWSSAAYNAAASMVPLLTKTVVSDLNVQPSDRILDLGCGDGELTVKLAQVASSGRVLGLDASRSFISSAQEKNSLSNCTYELWDCTKLQEHPSVIDGSWDKVFSNAAMHWILRKPEIRQQFFDNAFNALKHDGIFVFEQGGWGNVAEVRAAATAALLHAGLSLEQALDACPWFFPDTAWMSSTLEKAGFEVIKCELEYRPTPLNPDNADRSGGLEGWVKLMCAQYLDVVPQSHRDSVLREICDVLGAVITQDDGSRSLGYTRLRAVAKKK